MSVLVALLIALVATFEWTSYRHDGNNSGAVITSQRFSGKLVRRWRYNADSRITSSPVVAGDFVYVGTWSGDIVALDRTTGYVRWSVHLGANSDEAYGGPRGVIGSVAVQPNRLFVVSGNCQAAALNPNTGRPLWRTSICTIKRNDDTYASPALVGSTVLFGIDMLEDRATDRGRVVALETKSGRFRWSFEPAMYVGVGVGVSATPVFDSGAGIAYLGTGNPMPVANPPPGDDPGSESIVALDVATGKALWIYGPVHPHDTNDDDFFASPNRFRMSASGSRARWLIGEGNKDGTYYVVDARSGSFVWKRWLGSVASSMIVGTAAVGQDRVFVPVYTNDRAGSINALRARDGKLLWSNTTDGEYESPLVWGDTVFSTEASGWLNAYRAADGASTGRWKLCGRATGRGPSATDDTLFVAAGTCLDAMALH